MYVCLCMYVCMYVCVYFCVYVCVNECMYLCVLVCMYVCMYVCVFMYVCMYVCMYACMHVCMHSFESRAAALVRESQWAVRLIIIISMRSWAKLHNVIIINTRGRSLQFFREHSDLKWNDWGLEILVFHYISYAYVNHSKDKHLDTVDTNGFSSV